MESSITNEEDAHYNDEVLFLDNLVEFHPEVFDRLDDDKKQLLKDYYLTGISNEDLPNNIFSYRKDILTSDPDIAQKAQQIFAEIVNQTDIDSFQYTTKPRP